MNTFSIEAIANSEANLAISLTIIFGSLLLILFTKALKQIKIDKANIKEVVDESIDDCEFKNNILNLLKMGSVNISERDGVFTFLFSPISSLIMYGGCSISVVNDTSLLIACRKVTIRFMEEIISGMNLLYFPKEVLVDKQELLTYLKHLKEKDKSSSHKFVTNDSMSEKIKMR